MSDLTMQEIDEALVQASSLFVTKGRDIPIDYDFLVKLCAAARRGAEMVEYCESLGWYGWSPKELVEYAAGQVEAYKRRAEKAEAALAAIKKDNLTLVRTPYKSKRK